MKKRRLKKKFKLFLVMYLVIFTFSFSILTLSKYAGKISGDGGVSIAKWEVSLDTTVNTSDVLNVVSGNVTQNYILKVTSKSETAVNYSVVLSNLPSEIEVKIDSGTYKTPTNNVITFNNVGRFNANDTNTDHTHTLTFNAPLDSDIPSTNEIIIDVKFVQVNP